MIDYVVRIYHSPSKFASPRFEEKSFKTQEEALVFQKEIQGLSEVYQRERKEN